MTQIINMVVSGGYLVPPYFMVNRRLPEEIMVDKSHTTPWISGGFFQCLKLTFLRCYRQVACNRSNPGKPKNYKERATRNPQFPVELSGVFELLAATLYRLQ